MRKIGVVTVGRSDYGIYQSLLRVIQADPHLDLQVIAAGMHLSASFGSTVGMIKADGFQVAHCVDMQLDDDSPAGIAKSMGLGMMGFAEVFADDPPDILVVLGDRFDMYAAALAALPFKIPIAHLHGGEVTHGAIDEALRHSLTKLSHLHFAATQDSARRIRQLGEEAWRITVSGAPALDALDTMSFLSKEELEKKFGLSLEEAPLLITFHPVTLQYEDAQWQIEELLAAIEESDLPSVFTAPNADTHGRMIRLAIENFVAKHPKAQFVENLGQQGYFSLMKQSLAMVGNSSSGIIEAASFGLPVINIGDRQGGRLRGANVIDVSCDRHEIISSLRFSREPEFQTTVKELTNPYRSTGLPAAHLIVERLKVIALDDKLLLKHFEDLAS